ncbi:MAG: cyclic peptide export ABC transporter [Chitinophagaceae bacterium]
MKRILKIILPLTGRAKLIKSVFLGILAGLTSFLFINIVSAVIAQLIAGKFAHTWEYLLIFITIILLFIWIRRTLSVIIIRLSQTLFWDLRKKIVSLVLRSDYEKLASRKTEVHAAIVSDVNMLTLASQNIIDFFTAAVLTIACFIYLATISGVLFGITLAVVFCGIAVFRLRSSVNMKNLLAARKLEDKFLASFNAVLNGFKELFMDARKGKDLYEQQVIPVSQKAYENNTKAYIGFLNNQITGHTIFYALIAGILIYLNAALQIEVRYTVTFVFTLLYLLGAINTIMVVMPLLVRAKVAADRLMDLKDQLEKEDRPLEKGHSAIFKDDLEQITTSNLQFRYGTEDKSFSIGPINLEIQKGDVIFIYGGNGSGKTTFIHTLLGLHIPTAGEIRVNNIAITNSLYPEYKSLFAVVFSDFYLFNKLLGIDEVNIADWNYYLKLFEIEDKVSIDDNGVFSTTDLSTGQRKRLALVAALLEEKPVLVIDEWAADQDPYFRKKFYTVIIPLLKQRGISIVAITHDDRYYDCADKLYKMEYGKLIAENVHIYNETVLTGS